jgi:cobyric acid synthase
MVRGFLINKFRGDPSLFDDGYRLIEQRSGWRGFGVLPWFARPICCLPRMRSILAPCHRVGG